MVRVELIKEVFHETYEFLPRNKGEVRKIDYTYRNIPQEDISIEFEKNGIATFYNSHHVSITKPCTASGLEKLQKLDKDYLDSIALKLSLRARNLLKIAIEYNEEN